MHESGATTYLLDSDGEAVAQAAESIGAAGLAVDVSDTEQVEAAVAAIVEQTGRLDSLVNNAGVLWDRVRWKLSDDE